MNRPEAKYYEPSVDEFAFEHYVEDLEKYCDELERKLSGHDILVEFADGLLADYKELNKALDKACERLELMAKDINELHGYFDNKYVKKNEWKEWALSDE